MEILGAASAPSSRQSVERKPIPNRTKIIYGFVAVVVLAFGFEAVKSVEPTNSREEQISERELGDPVEIVESATPLQWQVLTATAAGLVTIDPSTGEVTPLGLDADVLGRAWGRVIVQDRRGRVSALDPALLASDLVVDLQPLDAVEYSRGTVPRKSVEPDHVWLATTDGAQVEVHLETGEVRQRVEDSPFVARGLVSTSPRFTSPQAGGVFRLDGAGEYEQVGPGTVLAEGEGAILVQTCQEALECQNVWLDAGSLREEPSLFAPEFQPGAVAVQPVGDGEFVAARYTSRVAGGAGAIIRLDHTEVIATRTGAELQLQSFELEPLLSGRADIAPDGSIVTALRGQDLFIRPSDSLTNTRMEIPPVRAGSLAVFIPKPPTEDRSSG